MGEKHWSQRVFFENYGIGGNSHPERAWGRNRKRRMWLVKGATFMDTYYENCLTSTLKGADTTLFTTAHSHMAMEFRLQFFQPDLHHLSTPWCWFPSYLCCVLAHPIATASCAVQGCLWNVDEFNRDTVQPSDFLSDSWPIAVSLWPHTEQSKLNKDTAWVSVYTSSRVRRKKLLVVLKRNCLPF